MVRRIDPDDRCVALISGRVAGEEPKTTSGSAAGKNLMLSLRNELVSKGFNASEVAVDKLGNVDFHCNLRSGKVIMALLDPKVQGADRQFRILSEINNQTIFDSDESSHQLRDLISRFWSTHSERAEWVTWKEAEDHGRTFRKPGPA